MVLPCYKVAIATRIRNFVQALIGKTRDVHWIKYVELLPFLPSHFHFGVLKIARSAFAFLLCPFFWIVACSLIRVDFNIATLCCACSHVWFGFYNQTTEHFSIKAVYFAHIFASLLFLWFLNQTQNISEIRNIVLVCFFFVTFPFVSDAYFNTNQPNW